MSGVSCACVDRAKSASRDLHPKIPSKQDVKIDVLTCREERKARMRTTSFCEIQMGT